MSTEPISDELLAEWERGHATTQLLVLEVRELRTQLQERTRQRDSARGRIAEAQRNTCNLMVYGSEEAITHLYHRLSKTEAQRDKLTEALRLTEPLLPKCVDPNGPGSCRDGRDSEYCHNCDVRRAARAALAEMEAKP